MPEFKKTLLGKTDVEKNSSFSKGIARETSMFCIPVFPSVFSLTFDRVKEVEERVVGDLFGNGANRAAAFMLLLLLNSLHSHILPLVPVYLTATERRCKKVRASLKQGRKKRSVKVPSGG